jgi:hypothetical protein
VVVTFTRTAPNTGVLRVYLNGGLAATSAGVTWALPQGDPLVFGGHSLTTGPALSRYYDGWLDELALLQGALNASEVSRLFAQSLSTYGGLSVSGVVEINVRTPLQAWRQTHFGTAANTGSAADTADADGDGVTNLLEYALGGDPRSALDAPAPTGASQISNSRIQLTFPRLRSELTYAVEASSDLITWTTIATNPGVVGQSVTVTDTVDLATATPARRFLRLRVTAP